MSKYGIAAYDDGLYGSGVASYDASPMWANPLDMSGTSLRVSWAIPDGSYTRLVLVRGRLGIPDNPDREPSTILADIDYSPASGDINRNQSVHFDDGLDPGREYFYAVYVWAPDPESASGYRWFLAGAVGATTVRPLDSGSHLRALLPAAMFTDDGGYVSGPVEDTSLLHAVTEGVGSVLDRMRTESGLLLDTYDTQRCPTLLVEAMSRTLGIGSEVSLPSRASRSLNRNAVRIFTSKGTADAIRLMTEALSGLDAYPSAGANLLPSPFYSGFEVEDSDISSGTLTAAPASISTMLKSATVSGIPGYPVRRSSDPSTLDTPPVLATIADSSGSKQHVVLLRRSSASSTQSTWEYVPSAKGTGSPSFGSGAVLRVNHNGTGWTASHGFVTEIETPGSGDPGDPPYTAETAEEALFTPLMDWRLRSKRVAAAIPEPLTLRYGPRHSVLLAEQYDGTDTLIVVEHPHAFIEGHRVTVEVDQLSLSGEYAVTRVIDAHRFTIDDRGTAYAAMNPATIGSGTTNYVTGPDHARVLSIAEDETYAFSVWVRSNAAAAVTLRVNWYEPTLALDSTLSSSSATTLVPDTWTKISLTGTSPIGTCYASLEVEFDGLSVNDLAYADNAQFELGSATGKYSDGRNVILQLATTITTDPGAVLRLRMKERLREVTAAGRTHTALLTQDESLTIAAGSSLLLPFRPTTRFFQNADPDTVLTEDHDATGLALDSSLSYVPAYDPESVFRVGGQDLLEVLLRADVLAVSGSTVVAAQEAEGDASAFAWKVSIQKASPTTATLTAVVFDADGSTITLSGTVPYEDGISRWYRMRVRATDASGSLSDGAALGLYYAADSIAEPSSWTLVDDHTASSLRLASPGDVRIGHAGDGAQVRAYQARVSRIAHFVANDYASGTAPNEYGAFESTQWTLQT